MHEMLHEKGINWADLPAECKNGTTFYKNISWGSNSDIEFTKDRDFLEKIF